MIVALLLAIAWDGPLIPVDAQRAVLAIECKRGQSLRWTPQLRLFSHGLGPGDEAWIITRLGAMRTTLGPAVCFEGECRGDYAALQLPRVADAFAVAPIPFLEGAEVSRVPDEIEPRNELEPIAMIRRGKKRYILWFKREGIGGPAKLTAVISRIDRSGHTFGRRFTGGGQPCGD